MHERPVVFGAPYSVYVRAVRLALEEKGIEYKLEPVDILAAEGVPSEHRLRQPFSKIPAFEHAGFHIYEAGAITRYVDEVFPGPRLQPESPRERASMNHIISVLDSYTYRTCSRPKCVLRAGGTASVRARVSCGRREGAVRGRMFCSRRQITARIRRFQACNGSC